MGFPIAIRLTIQRAELAWRISKRVRMGKEKWEDVCFEEKRDLFCGSIRGRKARWKKIRRPRLGLKDTLCKLGLPQDFRANRHTYIFIYIDAVEICSLSQNQHRPDVTPRCEMTAEVDVPSVMIPWQLITITDNLRNSR